MMKQTQRNRKRMGRILAAVLCFALCMVSIPVQAADKTLHRMQIKAGFFAWDGYHVQNEDGVRSGYGYDFLKMTENYCNWKIEFVGYDKTWSDMLDMLDAGEIDVLTSAQKSPEWEAKYDYTEEPIGNSATILSVRQGETQYVVGDPATYDGMTIGALRGSSRNDRFTEFAAEEGFSYTFVYYDSLEDLKDALAQKTVDGVLSTNLRTVNGETVLEEFDPVDYYAIVRKGNAEIMDQLNHAISKMNFNTPSWKTQLQQQYFSDPGQKEMVFNKSELEYLEELKTEKKVLTVVTNPDLAPYSYYDDEGNPEGIVPELFQELARQVGLSYDFVSFDTYKDYNYYVRAGNADIDLTCFGDYGLAADHGIDLTNSYLTTSLAMVSKDTFNGKIKSVGQVEGSLNNTTYADKLFGDYPYKVYDTNRECIEAVLNGKADVAYQYTYTAQKSVEEDQKNRLMYTILPQYEIQMCMGVNENLDYRMISVLNEGIRALSGTYTEGLIQEAITHIAEQDTLVSVIYDYPEYALGTLGLLVAALAAAVYVMQKRKQTEKLLERESEINTVRTEFFMMISHELRTPLNAVVSYLRILKEDSGDEKTRMDYIEKAQRAAFQLTAISDAMLDYSRISSGTIRLKDEIIKFKDVMIQVNQMISLKANEKKQDFSFEAINLSRQYFAGDGLRLSLILQNIMENAVKFTPEGGRIEAKVREELVDQEHVRLVFSCRDNGKGMSEAFTKKIDMAFHQSDPSYSRTHGGLGLGLFLTQYYVKMMNGSFTVESREGEGSLFEIVLPMRCPPIEELVERGIRCQPVRTIGLETNEAYKETAKVNLKKIGIKADILDDMEQIVKRIKSRIGGPYEYSVCIINVDETEETEHYIDLLCSMEQGPEIYVMSEKRDTVTAMKTDTRISHFIYIPDSYFELFNAFSTDFGEFKKQEKKCEDYHFEDIHAMIVEDNKINADILRRILSKVHVKTTVCENGQIAVDTFEREGSGTFQIIFMDVQMPVMNGLMAAERIRSSFRKDGRKIPIIAVSANAFPEDVKKTKEAGMNAHIAKPVDVHVLYKQIETYCSEKVKG